MTDTLNYTGKGKQEKLSFDKAIDLANKGGLEEKEIKALKKKFEKEKKDIIPASKKI